jgi:Protein of unknown function (Hypoth_ymh)
MPSLIEYLPTADVLLELEPEDLGAILIDMLHRNRMGARFALSNIEMPLWNAQSPGYPHQKRQAVGRALAEAWAWLQTEGLMMPDPEQPNGWFCLTRRGERLKSSVDIEAYRKGSLLPASALHPGLVEKVRPMFLRGDYDDAVFKAFKTLEMAVRAIASLPDDMNAVTVLPPLSDGSLDASAAHLVRDARSAALNDRMRIPFSHAFRTLQRKRDFYWFCSHFAKKARFYWFCALCAIHAIAALAAMRYSSDGRLSTS